MGRFWISAIALFLCVAGVSALLFPDQSSDPRTSAPGSDPGRSAFPTMADGSGTPAPSTGGKVSSPPGWNLSPFQRLDCFTSAGVRLNTTACNPDEEKELLSDEIRGFSRKVLDGDLESSVDVSVLFEDCTRLILGNTPSHEASGKTCDLKVMEIERTSMVENLANGARLGHFDAMEAYGRYLMYEHRRYALMRDALLLPRDQQPTGWTPDLDLTMIRDRMLSLKAQFDELSGSGAGTHPILKIMARDFQEKG